MASQIEHFLDQFQNVIDQIKPKNEVESEDYIKSEDCQITSKSKVVDSVEILSFSSLLHLYMGFYIFLWNQPLIGMCIYQLFAFILAQSLFEYNFFSFIFHPFFKHHIQDIVLPQTLYTLFDYYILTTSYNNYFIIFMNIILYTFSNQYFKNIENNDSKKVRTFMNILIYFVKFSYVKIIYGLFH